MDIPLHSPLTANGGSPPGPPTRRAAEGKEKSGFLPTLRQAFRAEGRGDPPPQGPPEPPQALEVRPDTPAPAKIEQLATDSGPGSGGVVMGLGCGEPEPEGTSTVATNTKGEAAPELPLTVTGLQTEIPMELLGLFPEGTITRDGVSLQHPLVVGTPPALFQVAGKPAEGAGRIGIPSLPGGSATDRETTGTGLSATTSLPTVDAEVSAGDQQKPAEAQGRGEASSAPSTVVPSAAEGGTKGGRIPLVLPAEFGTTLTRALPKETRGAKAALREGTQPTPARSERGRGTTGEPILTPQQVRGGEGESRPATLRPRLQPAEAIRMTEGERSVLSFASEGEAERPVPTGTSATLPLHSSRSMKRDGSVRLQSDPEPRPIPRATETRAGSEPAVEGERGTELRPIRWEGKGLPLTSGGSEDRNGEVEDQPGGDAAPLRLNTQRASGATGEENPSGRVEPADMAITSAGGEAVRPGRGSIAQIRDGAVAPPRSGAALPPPVVQSVIGQIVREAAVLIEGRSSEMRLVLQPESLGEVALRVRVEEGRIDARIDVTQASVKSAVESNLPQLRQALADRGLIVQRFDVCTTGDAPARHQDEQRGQARKRREPSFDGRIEAVQAEPGVRMFGYNTIDVTM